MKINKTKQNMKIRLVMIALISLIVILSGTLFSINSFKNGETAGGIIGAFIALTILVFFLFTSIRGYKDIKGGYPVHDERSRRVLEKASSKAFYVSLYLLLAIGFLSDDMIQFRDVSQATGTAVGIMALLFAIFWVYYNRKEI